MIVGLCGTAGSGKDAAAAHLTAHHGYTRRAFADPMRTALYALDPLVTTGAAVFRLAELVDRVGWDAAKQHPDVRRMLQRFGTEVGRDQWGEDFWVQRATGDLHPGDAVVFTDVRFPNEAAAVAALGGIVVEIRRPGVHLEATVAAHASEAMAFDRDAVVVNDDTLATLHERLMAVVGAVPVG